MTVLPPLLIQRRLCELASSHGPGPGCTGYRARFAASASVGCKRFDSRACPSTEISQFRPTPTGPMSHNR